MSTLDYLLALALLAVVLWNMRPHELTDRRLRRPLIIAAVLCATFLHGVPTAGPGGALVALGVGIGVACGALSARFTRVERDTASGALVAVASPLAIGVTAAAFVARLAFAIAATSGLGPAIGRFSSEIGIHSAQPWVAALVLMAVSDLVTRTLLVWRRRTAAAGTPYAARLAA